MTAIKQRILLTCTTDTYVNSVYHLTSNNRKNKCISFSPSGFLTSIIHASLSGNKITFRFIPHLESLGFGKLCSPTDLENATSLVRPSLQVTRLLAGSKRLTHNFRLAANFPTSSASMSDQCIYRDNPLSRQKK